MPLERNTPAAQRPKPYSHPMPQTLLLDLVREPPQSRGDPAARNSGNPYQGRWRWWYSAIADHMIRHPDGKIQDIAAALGKQPNTISMIINTDIFRTYLQQRKTAWVAEHDFALRTRLTEVATKGLDLIADVLEKKGDQIPLQRLAAITESSLDRLGYAPSSGPQVVVNTGTIDQSQKTLNVSSDVLREARDKMRVIEQEKAGQSLPEPSLTPATSTLEAPEGAALRADSVSETEAEALERWLDASISREV